METHERLLFALVPPPSERDLLAQSVYVERLARSLVRDDVARDVVQDTYLAALENAPSNEAALRVWLRTVVRRIAMRRVARDNARRYRERIAARPDLDAVDAREVEVAERLLRRIVGELEDPYREVIELRFFEGLPPRAIALRVARPVNTVNKQLSRGLRRLRVKLEAHGVFDSRRSFALAPLALLRRWSRKLGAAARPSSPVGTLRFRMLAAGAIAVASLVVLAPFGGRAESSSWSPSTSATREDRLADGVEVAPLERESASVFPVATSGDPDAASADAVSGERRIAVRVVDPSGRVVRDATLEARRRDGTDVALARTDADGLALLVVGEEFTGVFEGVVDGASRAALVALAPGRVASDTYDVYCRSGETTEVTIEVGGPAQTISGRVLDYDGVPVAGANLVFITRGARPDAKRTVPLKRRRNRQVLSGPGGEFRVEHVEPGRVRVRVCARGFGGAWRWTGSELSGETWCEIHLGRSPMVEGVVFGADGAPVPGARVGVLVGGPGRYEEVVADAAGRYAFTGIEPGTWRFAAWHPDDLGLGAQARLEVVRDHPNHWSPTLAPRDGIHLSLVDAAGEPAPDLVVLLATPGLDTEWRRAYNPRSDGRLDVYDAPDVELQARVYVKGETFPRDVLRVRAADERREVRVSPAVEDTGTVAGVVDAAVGRFPCDARLFLWDLASEIPFCLSVDPSDGRFRLEGVPPGRYVLEGRLGLLGSTVLGAFEVEAGRTVEVAAPDSTRGRVELDWLLPETLEHRYALDAILEIGGVRVERSVDCGARPPATYELLPGEYRLRAFARDELMAEQSFRVEKGAVARPVLGPREELAARR